MAASPMSDVIQDLRRTALLRDAAGLTDGQLLGCFVAQRDEAAFAALVRRHGPMVWGVCRRLLNPHDAEDAFQATFLVLVRKAASVVPRERVANWLYGVARQAALQARRTAARRRAREQQVTEMPEPAEREQDLWRDLQPLLDQELSRLPGAYREVIVLSDLEGKTRREVARQLGLPEGTVGSRLARARAMLAKRLARHGLAVSGGAWAAVASARATAACVPASVVSSTLQAASLWAAGRAPVTGAISVQVAALAEGVLKTMLLTKLKAALAVVLVLGFLAAGVTVLTGGKAAAHGGMPPLATTTSPGEGEKSAAAEKRVDSIQGTWELVSSVYDGKPAPPAGRQIWTITATHVEYNHTTKDAYVIDSKANPRQISLTQIRPGNERADGAKIIGIYEVKGDTLKICVAHSGKARPRAFESTAGGGQNLHNLKRVKTPQPQGRDKAAFTAWGKEVGGLQAGLGFRPGERRAYHHGETVTLAVRVRNVGKETVKFEYVRQFLDENLPTVTNADGKAVEQHRLAMLGFHVPTEVTLEPGKEIELESRGPLRYELRPANGGGEPTTKARTLFVGTGKVSIQYQRVLGNSSAGRIRLDPALSKLATGKLELEIRPAPPEPPAATEKK
jgi:RNA polymerase sigma factor (sigma-70 family)